ncbi:hypothetical protein X769_15925 [Mesorhizobium sp. LSJC268A00]|nr:hypothetical protein X769_15925 [Mesorhizobium sp. LSJC268A00]ESZ51760.1 hypothetical protein X731_06750 [Mesorhizobium sp. L2C054A000]
MVNRVLKEALFSRVVLPKRWALQPHYGETKRLEEAWGQIHWFAHSLLVIVCTGRLTAW